MVILSSKKINPTKLFIQKMRTSNLHFLIITLACILFACKDNNDIEPARLFHLKML